MARILFGTAVACACATAHGNEAISALPDSAKPMPEEN